MENQDKINEITQRKPESEQHSTSNQLYRNQQQNQLIQREQKLNSSYDDVKNNPDLSNMKFNQSLQIQNLSFKQQKIFFLKVQSLLLLWTIIHVCCGKFFEVHTAQGSFNYYFYSLAILLIFKLSTVYLWIEDKYKKYSILTYFVSIGLYTATFFCLYASIEKSQFYVVYIMLPLIVTQFFNFIIAVMFIPYLIFEKTEIRTTRFLLFVSIITLLISVCYQKMVFLIIFSIPYAILQTNNFKKIAEGKFQLKENQVFLGALVMNFQIYFPFNGMKH